jgi:hypothetical protein
LTQQPIDGNGVQQFQVDRTRGFLLPNGNDKNWLKVERLSVIDSGDIYGYIAYFGTRIRYEDWISRSNVPPSFFNASQRLNGSNNDWYDYLITENWEIRLSCEIQSDTETGLVSYYNSWPFVFKDYDSNANIISEHYYKRSSDNTLLNVGVDQETGKPLGVILENEETIIQIEYTSDTFFDISSVYAVTTLEIDKGAGEWEMRQISSVYERSIDNPLKSVDGTNKLKLEIAQGNTNKLITTCKVDPTLLNKSARYRITGRLGCKTEQNNDPLGIYDVQYESKYE